MKNIETLYILMQSDANKKKNFFSYSPNFLDKSDKNT